MMKSLERFSLLMAVVNRAKIVKDKATNRSRGFGFVEMENDDEARVAIDDLNGKDIGGRAIKVNEAKPKE